MRCEEVELQLAEAADGSEIVDRSVLSHIDHCLRCQAEAVQYRKLLKVLRNLRTQVIEPAPGLLAEVLAGIESAGERRAIRSMLTGRRVAYVGGIAVAGSAAAAGALLLAKRRRGLKLAS